MSEPLLEVRDLSVAFRQGGRVTLAVDRVSLAIGRGDHGQRHPRGVRGV